jgi:MGT family glycosyltransferase
MAFFIVMTGSEDGHVNPCFPIVRKLLERGHEVVWYTGRKYERKITAIGAKFHPLPMKTDSSLMEDMYAFHPGLKGKTGLTQLKYYLKHIFLDACEPEMEELQTILAGFPADVLIGDTITFSTYFQSELSGIPSALISLLPLPLPDKEVAPFGMGLIPGTNFISRTRNRFLNFLTNQVILRDVTQYANKTRRKLGLPPLEGSFFPAMFQIPDLIMHISTPAFEYPRSKLPESIHFIGPVLKEKETAFQPPAWWGDLEGKKPVILINQGTIAKNLEDLLQPAIDGLQDEEMLVIGVPVKDGQISRIPSNVRLEPFIPFEHILPHVDVMVTNGGFGGVQMALAHGIPLVVAGDTDDKMEVAARVEWSRCGINLHKQSPTPDEIKNAVRILLNTPVYRENAKKIQADFSRTNAPQTAVELLEDLVNRGRETKIASQAASKRI